MRILVAGGTGLLGQALIKRLHAEGHDIAVLTRHPSRPGDVSWDGVARAVDRADIVVNLAGEPIAAGRWTEARKRAIRDSRVASTRTLVNAARRRTASPLRAFISGSAIGLYGARGDEVVTEHSLPGTGFLADVCRAWEAEALQLDGSTRVVLLRTGLVLSRDGGVLPPLVRQFKAFAGGWLGSGRQYWSWIHIDDWAAMVKWALDDDQVAGPLNVTAPQPVTNREFASALAHVLKRPSWLPVPAFAIRFVFGEMGEALMLTGARVVPTKAMAAGFRFMYPEIEGALRAACGVHG